MPTDVVKLYEREREYQKQAFGEYMEINSLNFASFQIFLEQYAKQAREAYTGKWEKQLPPWLKSCNESVRDGAAPAFSYEQVIKVMALAGAALETYADIDAEEWRKNPEEEAKKWE